MPAIPASKAERRGKENNMEVQKIILEPIRKTNKEQTGKLRVAAYCRVSSLSAEQLHIIFYMLQQHI